MDDDADVLSFLDDVVVVARDAGALGRIVEKIIEDDGECGLRLNEGKCVANVAVRGWRSFDADSGVVVLGTPLGSEEFVRRHAMEAVRKAVEIEAAICKAPLPLHDKFMLLAYCGAHSRLVHLLRTTPPSLLDAALAAADDATRGALRGLLDGEAVPEWAFLPARLGGLGIDGKEKKRAGLAPPSGYTTSARTHPVNSRTRRGDPSDGGELAVLL